MESLSRDLSDENTNPGFIGGLALGWGYFGSMLRKQEIPLPAELVTFARQEQVQRLKNFFAMTK